MSSAQQAGIGLMLAALSAIPVRAAELPPFGDPAVTHWPPSRGYHVENYLLRLHFDQAQGEVFGDEVVTLRPISAGFRRFYLDSGELGMDSVTLLPAKDKPLALRHDTDASRLWITLDRDYAPQDRLRVRIVYHGRPRFGLFFDNPDSAYPDTPREIWTQGESEFNHYWFPCWDYPNDMATSETVVTVPEGQVVVSNGRLAKVSHAAGQVTYDWVESVPHSSYLTSLAIGPWEKVHDSYHGKPVDYYVPRGTDEATVRRAFGLTPDMIGFFSRASIEYPYEQYAQDTVHDFFFGGMENVSATTLQEWALQDPQASVDFPMAETVAHELAQHWFGDYAQGRDWANIWLNEGFATYFPALYTQYHEGNDAYRLQMLGYQDEAKRQDREDYLRPIVDRHYPNAMDMFDSITHEKGAAVLDMLRYLLDGPEAAGQVATNRERFFGALRHYLQTHAAESTDTADLEQALRDATGEELGWFFREWVYMAGTPAYRVTASYDAAAKQETLRIVQTQKGENVPAVFEMPVQVAFHGANGETQQLQLRDDQADQSFTVSLDFRPLWVDFDPDGFLLKTLEFDQPIEALTAAAEQDPAMVSRLWAAGELGKRQGAEAEQAVTALSRVLENDPFYGVRMAAAASLGLLGTVGAKQPLLAAMSQGDSRVRTAVVQALGRLHGDADAYKALGDALQHDSSYAVQAAAAAAIGRSGMPDAFDLLQAKAATKPEIHVLRAVEGALAATGDPRAVDLLLAYARPGMPIRARLSALAGLAVLKDAVERGHGLEFAEILDQTLHDTYFPLRQTAQSLAATFHLVQFRPAIQDEAEHAPTLWQRQAAEALLARFSPASP
ncbi:MAG TPA: M1 family aminopeptidase [Gammaproteobacteria bacterium]|nr:M1 family aminopeptidase [Gammaproteobacteria bacterium]